MNITKTRIAINSETKLQDLLIQIEDNLVNTYSKLISIKFTKDDNQDILNSTIYNIEYEYETPVGKSTKKASPREQTLPTVAW